MNSGSSDETIVIARRFGSDGVPLLTVYALLLFLIPASLIFGPLGNQGTPALVFSVCGMILFLASWLSGRVKASSRGRLVRIAMLIFSVAVLASFVAAMTRDISQAEVLGADSGLIWLTSSVGLVIVVTQTVHDFSRLDLLLRRLVVLGTVVAAIGILQSRGVDLTRFLHIPWLKVNSQIDAMSRGGFIRPESTASQPIEFGVVMAMLLPFAVQQAFQLHRGGRLRRWLPPVLIGVAAPLTVSRSGVIGVAVALLFIIPTWRIGRILGALLVIGAAVGMLRVLSHGLVSTLITTFGSIFNGQDSSANARVADYSGVSQYFGERPLFGRGFGTFIPQLYRFTDNMYLHAIVEIGIVGTLAFCFLFCAGIQSAALGRRRARQEGQRDIGQALVASMMVAMTTSATFDSFSFPMFAGLFFVLLGCCGAYCSMMTEEAEKLALVDQVPRIDSSLRNSFYVPR